MQTTTRIKLNRSVLTVEQGPALKPRRVSNSWQIKAAHAMLTTTSNVRNSKEPNHNQLQPAPSKHSASSFIARETGKRIRCRLRVALHFCGEQSSGRTHSTSAPGPGPGLSRTSSLSPSHSCTVSRCIKGKGTAQTVAATHSGTGNQQVPQILNKRSSDPGYQTQSRPKGKGRGNAKPTPNFNRKASLRRFGSVTRLVSGRNCKRSVKNSCCALCGDQKYTPTNGKKLAKNHKHRSSHPVSYHKSNSRQPYRQRKQKVADIHPVALSPQMTRVIIWLGKYPTVKLCDVAHVFDVTSHDFSCVLPVVLLQKKRHKRVKCFKKEFRSLMRKDDGCKEKWIVNQVCKICPPTNSSASFSSGDQASEASGGEHISDAVENGERIHTTSGILRPSFSEGAFGQYLGENPVHGDRSLSAALDAQHFLPRRVPPLLLKRVLTSNGVDQSLCSQSPGLAEQSNVEINETDPNQSCQEDNDGNINSDMETTSFDPFSCQRTSPYVLDSKLSCARTCKAWPFPRHGPPIEMKSTGGPRWTETLDNGICSNSSDQTLKKNINDFEPSKPNKGSSECSKRLVQCPKLKSNISTPEVAQNKFMELQNHVCTDLESCLCKDVALTAASNCVENKLNNMESYPSTCFKRTASRNIGTQLIPAIHQTSEVSDISSTFLPLKLTAVSSQNDSENIKELVHSKPCCNTLVSSDSKYCDSRNIQTCTCKLERKINKNVSSASKLLKNTQRDPEENLPKLKESTNSTRAKIQGVATSTSIQIKSRRDMTKHTCFSENSESMLVQNGRESNETMDLSDRIPSADHEVNFSLKRSAEYFKNLGECSETEFLKNSGTVTNHSEAFQIQHKPSRLVENLSKLMKTCPLTSLPSDKNNNALKVSNLINCSQSPPKQTCNSTETGAASYVSDLQLKQNFPVILPSTLEPKTSTMMHVSNESLLSPIAVTVPSRTDQIPNYTYKDKTESNLELGRQKILDPKASLNVEGKESRLLFDTTEGEVYYCSSEKDELSSQSLSTLLAEDLTLQHESNTLNTSHSTTHASECSAFNKNDLDLIRAYKEDALVLDVIEDDPYLFGNIVMDTPTSSGSQNDALSVLSVRKKNGQTKKSTARNQKRIVWDLDTHSLKKAVHPSFDANVKSHEGFCPVKVNAAVQNIKRHLVDPRKVAPFNPNAAILNNDAHNNVKQPTRGSLCNDDGLTQLVVDSQSHVHTIIRQDGSVVNTPYCWFYFNEQRQCMRNACRYLHLPKDNDEKFCMDTVQKFCTTGSPDVVQRAVEVFVGYYRTNSPGVSFSHNVVIALLSSLLCLELLQDLVSVINTLITHKRTPQADFVVTLYEYVREKGIIGFVTDLILLTSQVLEAGCMFTIEQYKMMQLQLEILQVPKQQLGIFHAIKFRALICNQSSNLSELVRAMFQVEIFKQKEDWEGLAHAFSNLCDGQHSATELTSFCHLVTMALMNEPKDKHAVPYVAFAESVCQEVLSDGLVKRLLGQVGISIMISYHRTKEWTKGVRLMGVMSRLKIEFSTLNGLFESEDKISRCHLLTLASELFINSGSIEGALNILRENQWFVNSSAWQCEKVDWENRRRILTLLAEKTSHRDSLEVLTNMPGIIQAVDGVHPNEYSAVFNKHLHRCMMNQVFAVAADTLEFMLTWKIATDMSELKGLIHKLGKQNLWSRARTLFQRAHSAGYYSAVACSDWLTIPWNLSEIEMTLAFEMFITCSPSLQTLADSAQPLIIILQRTSGNDEVMESEYLAAGCRLLSAAMIPNPKLNIHYTTVNPKKEQIFHLDHASAAKWLTHNNSWAKDIWAEIHSQ